MVILCQMSSLLGSQRLVSSCFVEVCIYTRLKYKDPLLIRLCFFNESVLWSVSSVVSPIFGKSQHCQLKPGNDNAKALGRDQLP